MADLTSIAKTNVNKTYANLALALQASATAITTYKAILEGTATEEQLAAVKGVDTPVLPVDDKGKGKEEVQVNGKKAKKPKDPNAPKRPVSPYFEYQNTVYAAYRDADKLENPEITHTETLRKISATWQDLPEDQKKPFLDLTATKLAQYEKEKAAYDLLHPGEYTGEDVEMNEATPVAAKKPKAKKAATPAAAPKDIVVAAPAEPIKEKKEKKDKKVAAPAAVVATPTKVKARKSVVKAVTPPAPAESSDSSSDDDSSDDSDDSSSEDELPVAVVPVASSSQKKRKDDKDSTKPKGKKSKSS